MDHFQDLTFAEKELRNKADILRFPIAGTFELLPLCNMDCKMCYVRMSKKELDHSGDRLRTADEWIELGKRAVEQGTMFLLLTGGEPFLYPDFVKVYNALRNMGLIIMINTNATMLTEEILNALAANKPRRLNISLYGSNDQIYADLCNNPKGFTQVNHAIELFQKNNIDVRLNMAMTPWNKDDLPNMLRYAYEKEIPTSIADYVFPAARKNLTLEQSKMHRFPPEIAGKYTIAYGSPYEEKEKILETARNRLNSVGRKKNPDMDLPCGFWCRGGASSYWVTWNHKMLPCGMMKEPCVDLAALGFKESWDALKEEMAKIRLCSECWECEKRSVCQTCAASMLAESGSFDKKPEYQCRFTDAMLEHCKELLEENNYE